MFIDTDIDDNLTLIIIIIIVIICLIFVFIFIYKFKFNVKRTGSGIYYGSNIGRNNRNGNGNNRIIDELDDEELDDEELDDEELDDEELDDEELDDDRHNIHFRNDRASIYYDNYGNEHTLLPNQTILVNGAPVENVERGGDGYFYNWNGHNYIISFSFLNSSLFMDDEEQVVNNMNNRMPVM